jgi:hypothetical protein
MPVAGHQEAYFSEFWPVVGGWNSSFAPIIRQSTASNISTKNCIVAWEGGREPRRSKQRGSGLATFMRRRPSKLDLRSHEPLPLSKAASVGGWRFMQKWFSGREFVAARDARRRSGFARTATAASAIAARLAAPRLVAGNAALPTAATNRVWRAGSIIATGNAPTGSVTRRPA